MKFFPKVVKSKLRLVRFLENKLNVARKSLHVAKFIANSMISSKGNACEMQNLQGTWKFPCTSQAIYLTCKLLARCMEISMYLATKHTSRYMEISMYLVMKHMARYMEISKYLAMKHMARYMEISMYLAMKHNARYMEISMYQLPYVSLQGCKQNIWRNIACHMFRCRVPCQWYCEKVSLLPKET